MPEACPSCNSVDTMVFKMAPKLGHCNACGKTWSRAQMPDAGKDAEEKWVPTEHGLGVTNGTESIWSIPEIADYLNALQQQLAGVTAERDGYRNDAAILDGLYHETLDKLADVRQERDRYRDALEYTQAYQWPLSPGVKIVLAAALTPGAKGETDVRAGE